MMMLSGIMVSFLDSLPVQLIIKCPAPAMVQSPIRSFPIIPQLEGKEAVKFSAGGTFGKTRVLMYLDKENVLGSCFTGRLPSLKVFRIIHLLSINKISHRVRKERKVLLFRIQPNIGCGRLEIQRVDVSPRKPGGIYRIRPVDIANRGTELERSTPKKTVQDTNTEYGNAKNLKQCLHFIHLPVKRIW